MSDLDKKHIDRLYALLKEKEQSDPDAAALRWAISNLELRQQSHESLPQIIRYVTEQELFTRFHAFMAPSRARELAKALCRPEIPDTSKPIRPSGAPSSKRTGKSRKHEPSGPEFSEPEGCFLRF